MMLLIAALITMGAGLLVLWAPEKMWKKVFSTGKLSNQTSVGSSLLFSGLFVTGLVLIIIQLSELKAGWSSGSWEPVNAVVVSSRIKKTSQPRSSGDAWVPDIQYNYLVGDRAYSGYTIKFGSVESTDREWIEDQVFNRFAVGKNMIVYYNPENPAQAVVERGYDYFLFAYVLVGFVLAAVGGFYCYELYDDWDGAKYDVKPGAGETA